MSRWKYIVACVVVLFVLLAGSVWAGGKTEEKTTEKAQVKTAPAAKGAYNESPMWAEMVKAGKLPKVEDRLPKEPLVIEPVEEIGQYGGTWRRVAVGVRDIGIFTSRLTYENLMRLDPMGNELVPNVVKAWEASADGKEFTFYLREGIKWSDGAPFTADDIVFWFEDFILNKELTPSFPTWLKSGGEGCTISKLDDYSVKFTFKNPHGLFLIYLATPNGRQLIEWPKHYMKQFHPRYAAQADLDKLVKEAEFETWYQLFGNKRDFVNPDIPRIYAWTLKEAPPAIPVVWERNPYYWKVDPEGNQLPYIDRVSFDIVEDKQTLNLKVMAGEVDMQSRHLLFDNFPLFKENEDKGGYRVFTWPSGVGTDYAIAFNQNHKDPVKKKIFQDRRFRIALSLAIDREEINEGVYLGMTEPSQVAPLPSSPFYLEEQAKAYIEHDPAQANKLLDEMGLTKRDSNGFRLRPDGKTLVVTIEYAPIFGSWDLSSELVKSHWEKVGVKTALKQEARTLFYERKQALEHDVGIWTGSGEFMPIIDPRWFVPVSAESIWGIGYAEYRVSGGERGEEPTGDVKKVIELHDRIIGTPDMKKQVELFHEILRLNAKNLWVIGVVTNPPFPFVVKNNFRNVPQRGLCDWNTLCPGATRTEQYFIRK